jgi:hypothetical protein
VANSLSAIDVFVSYSTADRERVRPLVAALVAAGLNVWWDRRISPGAGFDTEIQKALDAARCVLVVWSRESVESEWVITEASEGLERGVLVPVSIDSVRPPLAFRRRQTIEIGDSATAADDLVRAVQGVLEGGKYEIREPRRRSARRWLWTAAAAVVGLVIGLAVRDTIDPGGQSATDPAPVVRAPLALEGWDDWKWINNPAPSMAISPTGETIVWVARDEAGHRSLTMRRLDRLAVVPVAGTEGAEKPFFSPDGRWIGYFVRGTLKRVPVAGGEPSVIATVSEHESWGASWGADDRIVYSVGRSGLKSISVFGGEVRTLTELDASRSEGSHRLPHHVRDYDVLLFSVFTGPEPSRHEVWALDLASGERRYLFDGLAPAYVATGHIVYARAEAVDRGALWTVPFDPGRLSVTGAARNVQSATGGREGSAYAVSHSGHLVYLPSQGLLHGELTVVESNGSTRVLARAPFFESPRFSNDGVHVASTVGFDATRPPSIWIYDVHTGAGRRFAEAGIFPLWDPDDRVITFGEPGVGLVRRQVDGSGARETLLLHEFNVGPDAWVPGGNTLVYSLVNPETVGDTFMLDLGGEPRHVYGEGAGRSTVTADGQWLALCTWPGGVLVGRLPDFTSVSIATEEGCTPRWGPGESRLYYQQFDKVWAVDVEIGSGIAFGRRQIVVDLHIPGRDNYDVDSRGRIVFTRHTYDAPRPPVLLLNWMHTLE